MPLVLELGLCYHTVSNYSATTAASKIGKPRRRTERLVKKIDFTTASLIALISISAWADSHTPEGKKIIDSWKHADLVTLVNLSELKGEWVLVKTLAPQIEGPERVTSLPDSSYKLDVTIENTDIMAQVTQVQEIDPITQATNLVKVKIPEQHYVGSVMLNTTYSRDEKSFFLIKHKGMSFIEKNSFNYQRTCRVSPVDKEMYCRITDEYEDDSYEVYVRLGDVPSNAPPPLPIPLKKFPNISSTILPSAPADSKLVPVNDPHLFLTPENWVGPSAYSTAIETNSPGAYLKIGFTGTSFAVVVDTSSLQAPPPQPMATPSPSKKKKKKKVPGYDEDEAPVEAYYPHQYEMPASFESEIPASEREHQPMRELPKIGFQIDGGDILWQIVPAVGKSISMQLAAGLPAGDHQIRVSLEGLGYDNRWVNPTDQLKITGFKIDADAATIAPALLPRRMVVYGDSITEGANVYLNNNTVLTKEWSETWDSRLAFQVDAEVSVIAYQGQGFAAQAPGKVPNLLESYEYVRQDVPRVFSNPDSVFILEGTNDGMMRADWVVDLLTRFRKVYPKAEIFIGVPFNTNGLYEVQGGFLTVVKTDLHVHLFNLRDGGAKLVKDHSFDNNHPDKTGHAIAADLIYRQLFQFFQ
jgi:lysophospholipase L1-like esterase